MLILGAVVLVTSLRFNQRDLGPLSALTGTESGGNLGDAAHYIRFVDFLRGEADSLPPAPFRYRPLTAVLAAPLPFDAMTAINVVNVLALAVASVSMWLLLRRLGCSERLASLGSLIFVVSFPTFYYGAIGYVDPLAVALMITVLEAAVAGRSAAVLLLLVVASALTRESTVIILPVLIVWAWTTWTDRRHVIAWAVGWGASFLLCIAIIRVGLNAPGTNYWRPSADRLRENAIRPRTWLSAVLTLGLPAAVVGCRRGRLHMISRPVLLTLTTGAGLCMLLFAYALTAAYADGRFLWPIYTFSVPAAALLARPTVQDLVDATPPRVRREILGSASDLPML